MLQDKTEKEMVLDLQKKIMEDLNYEEYGKEKNDARRHYEIIRLLL